ncbi:hypothetical protein [Pandoraea communis]|uniref:hypothetical protein n=1 Tax=Pandoraea communis TaxID=2508297 RepID=UPI00124249F2|nr:hypothetical protein [Pandoraea communis]
MSVDRRGFRFSLEPLRQRAAWQLNAARDALGNAVTATQQARAGRDALQANLQSQAQRVDGAGVTDGSRLDVGQRMTALAYLSTLHVKLDEAMERVEACELLEIECREACASAQMDVERLDRVRKGHWDAYVRDQTALVAREADADWIARTAHLKESSDGPR